MPANDYYDSTGAPSTSSTISSSTLRAEFDAIETGFTAVQAALGLKATSLLTGYTSAAGTVAATDTILQAIQKLNGNDATNANLTGHVTSVGNATVLGSFTVAQLNTAISDGDIATGGGTATGTNTGDQTNITGNAATVTTNANLTGPVTSVGNATAIADAALSIAKTSGLQTALDAKSPLASPTFTGTVTLPTLVGSNATDATSETAAAMKTAGGFAAAKSIWSGTGFTLGTSGSTVVTTQDTDGALKITVGLEAFRFGAPITASKSRHTMFGVDALASMTGVGTDDNTAIGYNALKLSTSGERNTAVGGYALASNLTNLYNTAVGYKALFANTTGGASNTGVGNEAGVGITSGANNVCIGSLSGTDAVVTLTTQSNYVVIGNNTTANANIKVAWTVTSDRRDKTDFANVPHGLDFVNLLMPTAYQYSTSRTDSTPVEGGKVRYGFLAQDILAIEGGNPVVIDNRDPDNLKFNESSLIPILVKAIQELSKKLDNLT